MIGASGQFKYSSSMNIPLRYNILHFAYVHPEHVLCEHHAVAIVCVNLSYACKHRVPKHLNYIYINTLSISTMYD